MLNPTGGLRIVNCANIEQHGVGDYVLCYKEARGKFPVEAGQLMRDTIAPRKRQILTVYWI